MTGSGFLGPRSCPVGGGGLRIRDGGIEVTPPSELEALEALIEPIGKLGAVLVGGQADGESAQS